MREEKNIRIDESGFHEKPGGEVQIEPELQIEDCALSGEETVVSREETDESAEESMESICDTEILSQGKIKHTTQMKTIVVAVLAAVVVVMGVCVCVNVHSYIDSHQYKISKNCVATNISSLHERCVSAQTETDVIYLTYDLLGTDTEEVVLYQSDGFKTLGAFTMYYRVYVSGFGYMGWAEEGMPAGTANLDKNIEFL